MARQMNFNAKIEVLEAKINKKQEELKKLKTELAEAKVKKANVDYKALIEYMERNGISAETVLESIKERPEENQD